MIRIQDIRQYGETPISDHMGVHLGQKFAALKELRKSFFLTLDEMNEIIRWKVGERQYNQQRLLRENNTDQAVRTLTEMAFAATDQNPKDRLRTQITTLCLLRGIHVSLASAILGLIFPEQYAMVNNRTWRQVFGDEKVAFSVHDYTSYMQELKRLSRELGWSLQTVYYSILEYDKYHDWRDDDSQQIEKEAFARLYTNSLIP